MKKDFIIEYELDGKQYTENYLGEQIVFINPPPDQGKSSWKLISAKWGNQNKSSDVTEALRKHIIHDQIEFYVFSLPSISPDPDWGNHKELVVEYEINGKRFKKSYTDDGGHGVVKIP
jgi:hypothetical protein